MLVACWSPKGGSGTTVTTILLALARARTAPGGVVVVDTAGDVPAVLGVPDPVGPGLCDWLTSGAEVGADALAHLEVEARPGLRLLPRGAVRATTGSLRGEALAALLGADERLIVADCGGADRSPGRELASAATLSLCVLRPCYLAVRRALEAPLQPTGVVLVREAGRTLQSRDIEEVMGVPVWAELPFDPAIARSVDAGLLAHRPPRQAARPLEKALAAVAR
jgi:MinD-like ATPase involved in chromosome partitioning or flagellar assembly